MSFRWTKYSAVVASAFFLTSGAVAQDLAIDGETVEAPLSAIDWLNQLENAEPTVTFPLGPIEAPIVDSGLPPAVTSTALSPTEGRAIGLLAPGVSGLPETLWQGADGQDIVDALRSLPDRLLPAQQELRLRLLLAQATAPAGLDTEAFLQERAVSLARTGRVAEARALLAQLDRLGPDAFADFAAFGLLTETDDLVCERASQLVPDDVAFDLRVFCLARGGDWSAAAVLVQTAAVLGDLPAEDALLLAQFLDPELADQALPSGPLREQSPLAFRIREAIGAPVTTTDLPLPYAVTDLRPQVPWKAQLDAAERLAAAGSVSPNQLLGLYTQRVPAASGGVWDRAAAIQQLDYALANGAPATVDAALATAINELGRMGLRVALADMFAPELVAFGQAKSSRPEVTELILLSRQYEAATAFDAVPELARAVALGDTASTAAPANALQNAVHSAFALPAQSYSGTALGQDVLVAMALVDEAAQGNPSALSEALMALRSIGFEDIARRTALQLLLAS